MEALACVAEGEVDQSGERTAHRGAGQCAGSGSQKSCGKAQPSELSPSWSWAHWEDETHFATCVALHDPALPPALEPLLGLV